MNNEYIRVCNWSEFQHYKKRNPPWIKLYRSLITDGQLMRLQVASRWLAVGLLILASETDNAIPHDPAWIKWRLRLDDDPDIAALVSIGFIEVYQDDSKMLAPRKQESIPETETETETEGETEERLLSQSAEADVENSLEDGLAWNARLAPIARKAGGESKVGDWLRRAKRNPDYYERVLYGLVSLRDRGALDFMVEPGEKMSPAILSVKCEGQPIEKRAIAEYWRMEQPDRSNGGPERVKAHAGGNV